MFVCALAAGVPRAVHSVLDVTTPALGAPGSSRVALCLVAQSRDVINATLQPLRDELLDSLPLPVDLFVVSILDCHPISTRRPRTS